VLVRLKLDSATREDVTALFWARMETGSGGHVSVVEALLDTYKKKSLDNDNSDVRTPGDSGKGIQSPAVPANVSDDDIVNADAMLQNYMRLSDDELAAAQNGKLAYDSAWPGKFVKITGDTSLEMHEVNKPGKPVTLPAGAGLSLTCVQPVNSGFMATGWSDGVVHIYETFQWAIELKTPMASLRARDNHGKQLPGRVTKIRVLRGKFLAVFSEFGRVDLWKCEGNEWECVKAAINTNHGKDAAFSKTGRVAIATNNNEYIRVFDASSGNLIIARALNFEVSHITMSPDGTHVAVIDDKNRLHVFEVVENKELKPVGEPVENADAIYLSWVEVKGTQYIAAVGKDRKLKKWKCEATGDIIGLKREGDSVSSEAAAAFTVSKTAISRDGQMVAHLCKDGTVLLVDGTTGEVTGNRISLGINKGITAIALSDDHSLLAVTGRDNKIKFWHTASCLPTGVEIDAPAGFTGYSLAITNDNKNILFGTYGKTILFPISTGAKHRLLHTSPRDAVHNGLALAGDLLAIRDADKNIHFVNIKDSEKQGKSHHSEEIEATGAFAITPDGRHVFCQGKNGKACILDREKESFKSVESGPGDGFDKLDALQVSPDSSMVWSLERSQINKWKIERKLGLAVADNVNNGAGIAVVSMDKLLNEFMEQIAPSIGATLANVDINELKAFLAQSADQLSDMQRAVRQALLAALNIPEPVTELNVFNAVLSMLPDDVAAGLAARLAEIIDGRAKPETQVLHKPDWVMVTDKQMAEISLDANEQSAMDLFKNAESSTETLLRTTLDAADGNDLIWQVVWGVVENEGDYKILNMLANSWQNNVGFVRHFKNKTLSDSDMNSLKYELRNTLEEDVDNDKLKFAANGAENVQEEVRPIAIRKAIAAGLALANYESLDEETRGNALRNIMKLLTWASPGCIDEDSVPIFFLKRYKANRLISNLPESLDII